MLCRSVEERWFGVRCHFRHGQPAKAGEPALYEERIVLIEAGSIDEAIEKAEAEAKEYISLLNNVEFLDAADAYRTPEERIGSGSEIYSLMRASELSDDKYLDNFFHTGKERTRHHDK